MKDNLKLSPRLEEAASYVRQGARLADIGTDHAYLPLRLLLDERISFAVACDIVDGPLERARRHIELYPDVKDKIQTYKTNGLMNVEGFSPTDITVCGMGGELIAQIIADASFTKDPKISLVLQPMTCAEELRLFLAQNGYKTVRESIVTEGRRVYEIINAVYDGQVRSFSQAEYLLGAYNIEHRNNDLALLAKKHISSLNKKISGLKKAGKYGNEYDGLLCQLVALCGESENENC